MSRVTRSSRRRLGCGGRARGMADVARKASLGRESLYNALSPGGNPAFATVMQVIRALGLRLRPAKAAR